MSDRLFGGYDKDLQRQYNETTKAEVYEDFMGYVEADAANDEIMSVARQLIDEILEKTNDKKQKQALEKIKDVLHPSHGWEPDNARIKPSPLTFTKEGSRDFKNKTKDAIYEESMAYSNSDASNHNKMKEAERLIDKILHPLTYQEIQHREKTIDKKTKQALEKIKDGLYPSYGYQYEMRQKGKENSQSSKT